MSNLLRGKEKIIFNPKNLPRHVGIIMDGNGRWAKKRGLPREAGHIQGARAFRNCVDDCAELGIRCVTFYAFSTENWRRPESEIKALIKLFNNYLDDLKSFKDKDYKLIFLGDLTRFDESTKQKMQNAMKDSEEKGGLVCCIAVNYGGRAEILSAVKKIVSEKKSCFNIPDISDLSEERFAEYLYTGNLPEVDLIIRPSGEKRISNFLIWQSAYAELIFMDNVLWPNFNKKYLIKALEEYAKRDRRFGGI